MAHHGAKTCPACLGLGKAINSRTSGLATRRRYRCSICGLRWTTVEMNLGDHTDPKRRTVGTMVNNYMKRKMRQLVEEL